MKLSILAGSTSQTVNVFIRDSSSTTGAGLTGLAYNTSSLVAYYALSRAAAASITLATQTVTGAYSSGGFVEISSANMPGWYRLDIPDAALASGRFVSIHLKGATNMAPLPIEIELTATNNQSATAFITGVNSLAPPTNWNSMVIDGSGRVDISKWSGTAVTGSVPPDAVFIRSATAQAGGSTSITLDSGASSTSSLYNDAVILIRSGTGAGQVNLITAYNGSTKVATVGTAWATNPDATSVFSVLASGPSAAVATVSGTVTANVTQWNGTAVNGSVPPDTVFIRSGTAQAGGSSTITLDSGAPSTDNIYQHCIIFIRSGTGVGQTNLIASYVGSTKVATVASAWITNPDNTSVFTVLADGPSAATVTGAVSLAAADSMNLDTGTAQTGAAGTITLRSGAAATDNLYRFLEITIYSGTGAGQSRVITGYVGSTKVATVDENWIITPDNTSMYRVSVIRSPKVDFTGSITIQAPVKKNKAMNGMPFYVRLNTGGPAIGLGSGLTAQRNVDNGGWGVGALGGVSEMGNGWYFLASASASDMNGDSVAFRFAGAGCVDALVTLFPVP
jgi:hypothetical protein